MKERPLMSTHVYLVRFTVQLDFLNLYGQKLKYFTINVAFAPKGHPIPAQRNALGKVSK
jgi:hypothetical protein